jgi:hypothetical protein
MRFVIGLDTHSLTTSLSKYFMSRFLNLTNQRYGQLIVLEDFQTVNHITKWLCQCSCGKKKWIRANSLRRGVTISCGCIRNRGNRLKHGMTKSKVYHAWANMKTRCSNLQRPEFSRYGGRGIELCERWMNFENFLTDVGLPPSAKHSIDRIDNDGNYEPGNIRWATHAQQLANRRYKKRTL